MDIFILILLKLIVLDRVCGGLPIKLVEHLLVNYTLALAWWSASGILGGMWYVASLPFNRDNKELEHDIMLLEQDSVGKEKEYKTESVEDGDWVLVSITHSSAG